MKKQRTIVREIRNEHLSANAKFFLDYDSCLIYSREHGAYWGEDHQGYTEDIDQAGEYGINGAVSILKQSGPEKQLSIILFEDNQQLFYIYSFQHRMYWKQSEYGYVRDRENAGKFTLEKSIELCNKGNFGTKLNECMIPC